MTAIKPTIKLFTTQDDDSNGIQIDSLIMKHNGINYHLYASTKDTINVFAQSIALYVLTINGSKGTMSLNAYMSPEPDPISCCYLHNRQDIKKILGAKWKQLSPRIITLNLINYLI